VEIFVDDTYDCYSAATVRDLPPGREKLIRELCVSIAEIIGLTGVMDLEVIDHDGEIYILEIDARLPSQTPIVVYHASGINYINEIFDLFTSGGFKDDRANQTGFASIIHLLVKGGGYAARGEHIMTEGGPLDYSKLPECETEMISDIHSAGQRGGSWRGMFINKGHTREELDIMEKKMFEKMNAGYRAEDGK